MTEAGAQPVQIVKFLVPSSAAEPVAVEVYRSGLRMVLVNRESIHLLDSSWRVLGVYFLLGASDDPDRFRAYVGEVGKSNLVQRVKQHAGQKEWWSRALLIASTSDDFNSAEIGWLEGRLYDVLNNAVACDLMNGNRPGDESLTVYERAQLEKYVEPIMAALRACGAPPDTADQKPSPKGRRAVTRYSESVADLIGARLLKPETLLTPLRKGFSTPARVLADGRLQVEDETFESLSAAAKAVTGSKAEAGWDFWGAPSGDGSFVPLAVLRDRLRENGTSADDATIAAAAAATARAAPKPGAVDAGSGSAKPESGLAAIIAQDPSRFPLPIFATYRGQRIEATIEAEGVVRLGDRTFTSPSMAAAAARTSAGYAGSGKAATNGWVWWRFLDEGGEVKPLNALRPPADVE